MNNSQHQHITVLGIIVLLCCLTALLGGCDGNNEIATTPQTDVDDSIKHPLGKQVACPGLQLQDDSAVPGETITATGVPQNFGPSALRVIATKANGETVVTPLPTIAGTPQGIAKFPAPLNPANVDDGGEVVLRLGNGESRCPDMQFHVEPLPKNVPTDYALTIQSLMEQFVDKVLLKMGFNSATLLLADPDTLPPAKLSAWLIKHLVSSDAPGALPALLKKAADNNDKTFERYLKASHIENALNNALIKLDTLPVGHLKQAQTAPKRRATALSQTAMAKAVRRPIVNSAVATMQKSQVNCTVYESPVNFDINSAQELSRFMTVHVSAVHDISIALQATGRFLALVGLVPGAGEVVDVSLGATNFVLAQSLAIVRAALPQDIASFRVKDVETRWVEDRKPSNPLHWSGAEVTAKGKDFNLAALTGKVVVKLVGMVPGLGLSVRFFRGFTPDALNKLIDNVTSGVCSKIQAPLYGPISVDDALFTNAKIIGNTVKLINRHDQYIGTKIGNSTLRVSLEDEKFNEPPDSNFRDFLIEVEPIDISVIPSFTRVETPGDIVTISATATNATGNPTLFKVRPSAGSVTANQGSRDLVVQLTTPTNHNQYPVEVEFRWLGRKLPPLTSPPRTTIAIVDTTGKVDIAPDSACLVAGNTLQLSAELQGFAPGNRGITWSTTGGRITNVSGLTATLVAPGTPGPVQVTATANADPTVSDTIEYAVSKTCLKKAWYPTTVFSIDGNGAYSFGGAPCPAKTLPEAQQKIRQFELPAVGQIPPASQLWYNRTETFSSLFTHESTRYEDFGEFPDKHCENVNLSGHNFTTVQYSGSLDGTLSVSMDANVEIECADYPSGGVECVGQGTSAVLAGYYYFKLGSAATYHLIGEMRCNSTVGAVDTVGEQILSIPVPGPIVIQMSRYTNGQYTSDFGVRTPDGKPRAPVLFLGSCNDDQVVPIDVTFKLDAPATSEDDLIVILIGGDVFALTDLFPLPDLSSRPTPGTYNAKGRFDFEVKLERQ